MDKKNRFWLIMLSLFGISVLYDRLVIKRMNHDQQMESLTWLTVVIGVAYTLFGVWLLDREAAKLAFVAFCFSGAPMSWGDIERYIEINRNGRQVMQNLTRQWNG